MESIIAKMDLMKEIAVRFKYYLDDCLGIEGVPTLRGKVRFKYLVQIQGFLDKKTRQYWKLIFVVVINPHKLYFSRIKGGPPPSK